MESIKQYLTEEVIKDQLSNLSQITFEITEACNLHCKYCGYGAFYDDHDKREDKKLPFEKATAILDYLNSYWQSGNSSSFENNVYISFYGGEPLLNMSLIKKIVAYVEQMDCANRRFYLLYYN